MPIKTARITIEIQLLFSAIIIFVLFTSPIIFSIRNDSFFINSVLTPWLQLAYIILNINHIKKALNALFRDKSFLALALCLFFVMGYGGPRNHVYLINALFFACLLGQLSTRHGPIFTKTVFWLKIFIVTSVSLALALFYIISDNSFQNALHELQLPIYRHIRHFNYELAFTIPLAAYLLVTQSKPRAVFYFLSLSLIIQSYFALASAGRGQALSLLITAIVAISYLIRKDNIKRAIAAFTSISIGFLGVFITGQQGYLLGSRMDRSSMDVNFNYMTSGRLSIWQDSLHVFNQQPIFQMIAGAKKEPIEYLSAAGYQTIVQPHNIFVQSILEYGYLGLALCILLFIWLGWRSIACCKTEKKLDEKSISAAIILGILGFSLTDGLFYHAMPLVMVTILIAVLVSKQTSAENSVIVNEKTHSKL